ncbi:hypothetical protein [Undibacterium sp. TS12]|uniref:hypothetical protein n=1 Tax=Undibacterium sp. TS12 TaxID=2908202 RepID=UPI001F4C72E7|nr:hypothetical protein [Undibacterium sp. TS12]MCH8619554.1 hypothetical protein [Undibacterium sp. TS12]
MDHKAAGISDALSSHVKGMFRGLSIDSAATTPLPRQAATTRQARQRMVLTQTLNDFMIVPITGEMKDRMSYLMLLHQTANSSWTDGGGASSPFYCGSRTCNDCRATRLMAGLIV